MLHVFIHRSLFHKVLNTQDSRRTCCLSRMLFIITPKFQPQSSSQLFPQEGSWSRQHKGRMLRLVLEQRQLCLNTQMPDPQAPVCLILAMFPDPPPAGSDFCSQFCAGNSPLVSACGRASINIWRGL